MSEREDFRSWLDNELAYADTKWPDDGHATEDGQPFDERIDWILNYALRAKLFGVDTEQGRLALGKAASAFVRINESAWRVHGPI